MAGLRGCSLRAVQQPNNWTFEEHSPAIAWIMKLVSMHLFTWTAIEVKYFQTKAGRLEQKLRKSNDAVLLNLRTVWLDRRSTILNDTFAIGQKGLELRRVQL